jgi:hypothetical protein
MHVYFNLVGPRDTIPDLQGIEVDDITQAQREAERAIAEFVREEPVPSANISLWRLEAVDISGTLLFSINLDSVVDWVPSSASGLLQFQENPEDVEANTAAVRLAAVNVPVSFVVHTYRTNLMERNTTT